MGYYTIYGNICQGTLLAPKVRQNIENNPRSHAETMGELKVMVIRLMGLEEAALAYDTY